MLQLTETQKKFIKYPGIFLILIFVYYFFYVGFEKNYFYRCEEVYCLTFIDFNDYVSILISILGILAVVETLDAWKDQHKFEKALLTLKELNEIEDLLEKFDLEFAKLQVQKSVGWGYKEVAENFYRNISYIKIKAIVQDLDTRIHDEKNNLHQKEFEALIDIAHKYYNDTMREFTSLKWKDNNSGDDNDIDRIQILFRGDRENFKNRLEKLKGKFRI